MAGQPAYAPWTPPPPLPSPLPSTKAERQALRDEQVEYYLRGEFLGNASQMRWARSKAHAMTASVGCSPSGPGKCDDDGSTCLCERHDV